VAGEFVAFAEIDPAVDVLSHLQVPHGMPARERDDGRLPDTGPRRGGKAATRKGQATRRRRKGRDSESTTPGPAVSPQKCDQPPLTILDQTETEKRLAALESRLGWNTSTITKGSES